MVSVSVYYIVLDERDGISAVILAVPIAKYLRDPFPSVQRPSCIVAKY